jgi:putative peptidoglycan lipid II flippase
MKRNILSFFNKEFNGINEAALLLGGFALLSQVLGLVRDRMLAYVVGAGPVLDIYYASFRIPDFLYISIASLASVTVIMPFVVEKINKDSSKVEAKKFMNNIFTAFMLFMIVASIILFIVMPYLVRFIAPGFDDHQTVTLVTISRIMLLSPIFIGLSNLVGTVTQMLKRFFIFSLSPIFYNLGILFGIIVLYPIFDLNGLAFGVILGAFLHLFIQIPGIIKSNFLPKIVLPIDWSEIKKVVKTSLPRTITLSCHSLAFIFIVSIASLLKDGSISLLSFSYNLQSVPVSIIGVSYSVAAFPVLVKAFSIKDIGNFINHTLVAVKQIIFWSLPIMSVFIVLRAQIVRVILGSETFTWADTRLTAAAISLFLLSLVTQGLVLLIVRAYYASGNTKKPLFANVLSSVFVVLFAYIFVYLFKNNEPILNFFEIILRVEGVPGTNMLALPLAFSLGSILNFILIWILFKKDFLKGRCSDLYITTRDSLISSLVMGFATYYLLNIFDDIFNLNTGMGIFLQGLCSGILGILVGVIVLFILNNNEIKNLLKAVKNKFWRKDVVNTEQSEL